MKSFNRESGIDSTELEKFGQDLKNMTSLQNLDLMFRR